MTYTKKQVFQQSIYQSNEIDSKHVFALRSEGKLQEAYQLATSLLESHGDDDWNKRAMAWVLVDIIKKEIAAHIFSISLTCLLCPFMIL